MRWLKNLISQGGDGNGYRTPCRRVEHRSQSMNSVSPSTFLEQGPDFGTAVDM